MSWINPNLAKPSAKVSTKPIIRDMVKSVRVDPMSGYPPSQRTHGRCEIIQLENHEKMSDRMAAAFFMLRVELEACGVKQINEPEIFPIDTRQCLVLMTGWIPEIIVLNP